MTNRNFLKWAMILPALFMCHELIGQNVAINADGSRANKNAILDIKSNTKGLLIPRMTTDARLRIEPTQGLMVYDVNTNSFWYNNGKQWKNISSANEALSASGAWLLTGNAGTTDIVNFLGTTDDVPLNIRVNNQQSGRIDRINRNTSWGYRSAFSTTGINNTAIGDRAFELNSSGNANTVIGAGAMSQGTIGDGNVAIGFESLFNNTGGGHTAVGFRALYTNTTSDFNTAVGQSAMYFNTTGSNNVGVGNSALGLNSTGNNNTAVGSLSLNSSSFGMDNTAVGYNSLHLSRESFNTAVGARSMNNNVFGHRNTAIGVNSLFTNNTGIHNTVAGYESMRDNTAGNENTTAGYRSLLRNTIGSGNVALGYEAVSNNTSGYGNVGVGPQALIANVTGIYNTGLGVFANVIAPNLTNATAIGYSAVVNASNKVRIGNAAVTVIEGQVPFTFPSDGRYKFGVQEDVKGLDFILQLRPVTYNFDTKRFDAQFGESVAGMDAAYAEATRIRRSGFIAQEVEEAANKAGYNFSAIITPAKDQKHYSLSYDLFVVPLVKAVQEQQQLIEQQEKYIQAQDKKMADMQRQLDEIKSLLKTSK